MLHHQLLLVDPNASRRCTLAAKLVEHARVVQVGDPATARVQFLRRRPRMVLLSLDQATSHGPALAHDLREMASWGASRVIGVYGASDSGDAHLALTLRHPYRLDFVVASPNEDELVQCVADTALAFSKGVPGRVVTEPPRITPSRWRRMLTEPVTAYTIRNMLRAS